MTWVDSAAAVPGRLRAAEPADDPRATLRGRGKSAAGLWGVQLARAQDCVQVVVPDNTRIARRAGLDVRRTVVRPHECTPWSEVAVATPLRTTLDLLLDRPLPDAAADLDAVFRVGLVALPQVGAMVEQRSDKGIVLARRAVELADPRAESRPESRVRVWLVFDGLHPVPQYHHLAVWRWLPVGSLPVAVPVAAHGGLTWVSGGPFHLRAQLAREGPVHERPRAVPDPARMVRTVRAALARRS